MKPISACGDYIGGRFLPVQTPSSELEIRSPANLDDLVGHFPIDLQHVDAAVGEARVAQRVWARTPLSERLALLRKLGEEIRSRKEPLAQRITREIGKPLWEAQLEVGALISKIQITEEEGLAFVRDFTLNEGKLECRYQPHGVLAVIGPFNFPLHLAHGHIVPALATGNTVVFKPSELAPGSAQLYAEALDAVGFPPGAFNLVQGGGKEGARLAAHPDVDGVLFTGSYETGTALAKANADKPGKLIALELGGKNAAVVLADAPFEKALYDVIFGAFATSGQRCTSASRLIVERSISEPFVKALIERSRALKVGDPFAPDTFMGPLASQHSLKKFLEAQRWADEEGSSSILASTEPQLKQRGYFVTPSIRGISEPSTQSRYQRSEIFGPDLAVYLADDAEHACALADASDYGLSAAVYTQREELFELFARRLKVGCLNWNAPTAGSSSRLPFGGLRRSGNHRPAALFSPLYCTWPMAISRGDSVLEPGKQAPGMNWEFSRL